MERRRFLQLVVGVAIFIGVVAASYPFLASLPPSSVITENQRIRIPISILRSNEALAFDWYGYKVFLVREPEINAYLMPYWDDVYWLPDPTWNRPLVPCKEMSKAYNLFSCVDHSLDEYWRDMARWDFEGKAISGGWMPNLQAAPHAIEGNYVVLSREYW